VIHRIPEKPRCLVNSAPVTDKWPWWHWVPRYPLGCSHRAHCASVSLGTIEMTKQKVTYSSFSFHPSACKGSCLKENSIWKSGLNCPQVFGGPRTLADLYADFKQAPSHHGVSQMTLHQICLRLLMPLAVSRWPQLFIPPIVQAMILLDGLTMRVWETSDRCFYNLKTSLPLTFKSSSRCCGS